MLGIGDVRHIVLAVHEGLPIRRFVAEMAGFAAGVRPVVVSRVSIGIFPGLRSMLFPGPVGTGESLALHGGSVTPCRLRELVGEPSPGPWFLASTLTMNASSAAGKAVAQVIRIGARQRTLPSARLQ